DKLFNEKYAPAAEKYFPVIKKYIKDAGNGYLVKGGPTWVDFYFAEFFDTLNNLIPDFYKTNPEFKKLTMPFGQVPVLEVDGKMLPQSFTINRYLARKYGLAGKDDFEQATVDAIGDSVMDFFNEFREWFLVAHGFAPGDKDKLYKEKYVPAAEKYFPVIIKYIKDAGNGYLVKGGPTWVDFHFAEFFDTLNNLIPDFYKTYPEFKKLNREEGVQIGIDRHTFIFMVI
uniref:glutathione transferase n=1 Tax=Acrobeloides nanus TaxID=290746 RepID=A0A914CPB0_9BILA